MRQGRVSPVEGLEGHPLVLVDDELPVGKRPAVGHHVAQCRRGVFPHRRRDAPDDEIFGFEPRAWRGQDRMRRVDGHGRPGGHAASPTMAIPLIVS
jgi:hypothetical protein